MKRKISAKLAVEKNNYSYPRLDVSILDLENTVKFLTTIRPPRNYRNIHSLNRVAAYIQKKFIQYGLATDMQEFEVEKTTYRNVIGISGDEKQERIIVGAHYDVCGDQPGADDNASAVAGLLEIARLVHRFRSTSKYRFDFVAYSLEEPPFFASEHMGSYIHAQSLSEQGISIRSMMCLEMIGYFTTVDNSQDYPFGIMKAIYPSRGNFIAVVGNMKSGHLVDEVIQHFNETSLLVESLKSPSLVTDVAFSDHLNYWKFGYQAVMITDTAFYRNRNYHQDTDTIDTLDFNKMGEVVKGVTWALINMS